MREGYRRHPQIGNGLKYPPPTCSSAKKNLWWDTLIDWKWIKIKKPQIGKSRSQRYLHSWNSAGVESSEIKKIYPWRLFGTGTLSWSDLWMWVCYCGSYEHMTGKRLQACLVALHPQCPQLSATFQPRALAEAAPHQHLECQPGKMASWHWPSCGVKRFSWTEWVTTSTLNLRVQEAYSSQKGFLKQDLPWLTIGEIAPSTEGMTLKVSCKYSL